MARSEFHFAGVTLKNRVLVASGTYGYGDDCLDIADVNKLGGIVTKSLSLKPREGNPPVRIAETPSGMLNSIGLANIGVHRFIAEKLPFLQTVDTAVFVNIAASSVEEYCEVLRILEEHDGIDGYEINVSCPNVKEVDAAAGRRITARTAPLPSRLSRRRRIQLPLKTVWTRKTQLPAGIS